MSGIYHGWTQSQSDREWNAQKRIAREIVSECESDFALFFEAFEDVYNSEAADIIDWLDNPVTDLELDLMASLGDFTQRQHDPRERTACVEYPEFGSAEWYKNVKQIEY